MKRSRDRDGHRDSDKDRDRDGGDREKDRDRKRSRHSRSTSRSRSRSPRHSHHRSSRPSSRSPSPPPSHSHSHSHSYSQSSEADKEEKERIRAEHTVFVSAIHPKVKERELFDFFSQCGRVEDVRLIKDNKTKRSKGLAYIEFKSADAVAAALTRHGQLLAGYPVTIQPTQYPPTKPTATQSSPDSMRLYVGSLQYAVTEVDLRPIFAAIGPLDSVEVHKDSATGVSKGFGFVQYRHKADAELAMATLQGLDVAGRPVSHALTLDDVWRNSTVVLRPTFLTCHVLCLFVCVCVAIQQMKIGLATQIGSGGGSGGYNMQPTHFSQLPSPSSAVAASLLPLQLPSSCLLIVNMFDPTEETEADWDQDIAEEMRDESSKFGRLLHVHVEKASAGHVYLRFDSVAAAQAAYAAMHGRFFGGRQLHATYIPEAAYTSRFPGSG